jgi:hypothetical protein
MNRVPAGAVRNIKNVAEREAILDFRLRILEYA